MSFHVSVGKDTKDKADGKGNKSVDVSLPVSLQIVVQKIDHEQGKQRRMHLRSGI